MATNGTTFQKDKIFFADGGKGILVIPFGTGFVQCNTKLGKVKLQLPDISQFAGSTSESVSIVIADTFGKAGTSSIEISTTNGDRIDNKKSVEITTNYGSLEIIRCGLKNMFTIPKGSGGSGVGELVAVTETLKLADLQKIYAGAPLTLFPNEEGFIHLPQYAIWNIKNNSIAFDVKDNMLIGWEDVKKDDAFQLNWNQMSSTEEGTFYIAPSLAFGEITGIQAFDPMVLTAPTAAVVPAVGNGRILKRTDEKCTEQ